MVLTRHHPDVAFCSVNVLVVTNSGTLKGVDGGGSPCHMWIIRNGNVALSNLTKPHVSLSNLRKDRVALLKKGLCRMSLRTKKGHVAVSILGVHTHF